MTAPKPKSPEDRIVTYLTTIYPRGASLGTLQASCRGYRDQHPSMRRRLIKTLLESGRIVARTEKFAEKYYIPGKPEGDRHE